MRILLKIFLILVIPFALSATEQDSDILIFNNDTIYFDLDFPLESFEDKKIKDKIINAQNGIRSSCWRGYIATWTIENDSLFLIKMITCEGYKDIDFNWLFGVKSNKIFADWFSGNINAQYGEILDYDNTTFEVVREGTFHSKFYNGKVKNICFDLKSDSAIEEILTNKKNKEDTIVNLFVDTYPILLYDNQEYAYSIDKHFSFPSEHICQKAYDFDCKKRVGITLIIEKDGSVTNMIDSTKICKVQLQEINRILELMDNWKPGIRNGNSVRTRIMIPFIFED